MTSVLVSAAMASGCPYGNGSPCEVPGDCASGVCCGRTPTVRGVCRPSEDMACLSIADAGPIDGSVVDTGIDANEDTGAEDTGVEDTGVEDTGIDASTDAGADAGAEDSGTDAPETDAGIDAG